MMYEPWVYVIGMVFGILAFYMAVRLASAAWHRSKMEVELKMKQEDQNGKA